MPVREQVKQYWKEERAKQRCDLRLQLWTSPTMRVSDVLSAVDNALEKGAAMSCLC